jgi:cobalt-zinc-cadmium efflux system outer membrane protein
MDQTTVMNLRAVLTGITLGLMLAGPASAFNAPKPIQSADFMRYFGVSPGIISTPSGRPLPTDPGALPLRPAITPNTGTVPSGASQPKNVPTSSGFLRRPGTTSGGSGVNSPTATQQPGETGQTLLVTQALNQGLLRSPRMAAVRANLEITRSNYLAATELPNPTLLRDEGYIAEQTTRMGAQTIYEPPWKIAFRLLVAKRQMRASKLDILNQMWLFRNDIRRIYTETVVAQESYQTLSELSALAARLQEVSSKRFQAGDVPELDVLKARLASSQATIEQEYGNRRVARAKQQLNIIMGSNMDTSISIPHLPPFQLRAEKSDLLPDFDRPVPALQDLIQLALANRLELKLIRQNIAVTRAQLYSAYGNIVPNPAVATGRSITGNPPTGPKLNGFFVSLNMELPVLSFQQGTVSRLNATIHQYYRQYQSQENQVTGEVAAAYNNLIAARERIRVYQDHVLADSLEVARLAQRSYEVGQSDITATLAAQQANVQIRSQYLDAVSAYQQAFTDLEQAVGEPLQ